MRRDSWTYVLFVIVLLSAACADQAPLVETDAASRADADAESGTDTTEVSDGSDETSLGHWEPTGGPFGGIQGITRVFDTIYLHGHSTHSDQIAAVSTDGGATWSEPTSEQAASLAGQERTTVYESEAQAVYLVQHTDDASKLYRKGSADAEWELMNSDLPAIYELEATGDLLALITDLPNGNHGVMVSEDHGRTWEHRTGESIPHVASLAAWRGRIYASSYGFTVFVSDDAGLSWAEEFSQNPGLIFGNPVDLAGTAAAVIHHNYADPSKNTTELATSTDGVHWDVMELTGEAATTKRLVNLDDQLYGITQNGAVGRLSLEGEWTQVTGPRGDFHWQFYDVTPVDDGFVIKDMYIARKWSPLSGWTTLDYGLVDASGIMFGGTIFAGGGHLMRLGTDGWELVTPDHWHSSEFLGATEDAIYYVLNYENCIYRYGPAGEEFVAQWANSRLYDDCADDRAQFGDLSGVASLDGEVFFSKFASEYYNPGGPGGGGVMSLDQFARVADGITDVRELTASSDRLWLITTDDLLYSSDGESLEDRTDEVEQDTGLQVERVATVAASGRRVYAHVILPGSDSELVYLSEQGWKVAPRLEVESLFRLPVNADGVWQVSDGSVWNFRPGDDEWREVSGGLPEGSRVRHVSADSQGVTAGVEGRGMWRLVEPE